MKKIIILSILCSVSISCNSGIDGEGAATGIGDFATDVFEELTIGCNCDITLIPSETTKVVVESHQNLIENININSKRKKLDISEKSRVDKFGLYNVNVYFNPEMNSVKIMDKARLKVSGTLKSSKMKFKIEDKTSVADTYVETDQLDISLSDKSSARITGTAMNLNIDTEDSAEADLADLQAVDVSFKSSDKSSVVVYPMKNLSGKASDNAIVKYLGDPNKDATAKDKSIIEKK